MKGVGVYICHIEIQLSVIKLQIFFQSDSPFHMVQPHSLVQFLDQGRKLDCIAHMRGFIEEHEVWFISVIY